MARRCSISSVPMGGGGWALRALKERPRGLWPRPPLFCLAGLGAARWAAPPPPNPPPPPPGNAPGMQAARPGRRQRPAPSQGAVAKTPQREPVGAKGKPRWYAVIRRYRQRRRWRRRRPRCLRCLLRPRSQWAGPPGCSTPSWSRRTPSRSQSPGCR